MIMKYLSLKISVLMLLLSTTIWAQQPEAGKFDWPYTIKNGTIVTEVPDMPAGQQSALCMMTPKLDVVRVAFVGLGMRGPGAVKRWTYIPGIQIMALCDYERERAEKCNKYLKEASMPPADIYDGEDGTTGVSEVRGVSEVCDDSWYTLGGRKLQGKPSRAGVYIIKAYRPHCPERAVGLLCM